MAEEDLFFFLLPHNMSSQVLDATALHPGELLRIYQQQVKFPLESQVIQLVGIYEPGNHQAYGGYYYDKLRDVQEDQFIPLMVSARYRASLLAGHVCTVRGTLQRKMRQGALLSVHLVVSGVQDMVFLEESSAETRARASLLEARLERPFYDFEKLIREKIELQQKVQVVVITGKTSIVDQEFEQAKGPSETWLDLQYLYTSMRDPQQIKETLVMAEALQPDAVVLMRGGGEGLDVFNDPSLLSAFMALPFLWATALGHAKDVLFAKQLADKTFDTPTAFGFFLRQAVEASVMSREHQKALLTQEISNQFQQQIATQTEQNQRLTAVLNQREALVEKMQLEVRRLFDGQQQQMQEHQQSLLEMRNQLTLAGQKHQEDLSNMQKRNQKLVWALLGTSAMALLTLIWKWFL
jgi:exodeoxyribonuclease VII large subunit